MKIFWTRGAYREAHYRVMDLHAVAEVDGITNDCADGECDHDPDEMCPTVKVHVCRECFYMVYPEGTVDDDAFVPEVIYPCATFRAAIGP